MTEVELGDVLTGPAAARGAVLPRGADHTPSVVLEEALNGSNPRALPMC
ncbi:hypothetical protein F5X71_14575 [Nocardia brasiliensis]|uniref:Uncharacterized protein n=1 Tax=Nocardia brasiliensis TaxID=37326 RepID=A0A6G9XR07_NOCBR|nr:hypothetical protein [Nocardia brasiliensis]QIS03382.1 hypothetical protein F5X71_14575 [Nocardia brasiliensis]